MRRNEIRGQSIVEFALVLPIVLLLMIGLFDLGRIVFVNNSLSDGARQGARTAIIDPRSGTYCADIEDAVRTAVRGQALATFTVTYQTIAANGSVGSTRIICADGAPNQALPSTATAGDRVSVQLIAGLNLITPFVAQATGQSAFTLNSESAMTVTFAPSPP
jgi:Flp pilus assembly protein TadG